MEKRNSFNKRGILGLIPGESEHFCWVSSKRGPFSVERENRKVLTSMWYLKFSLKFIQGFHFPHAWNPVYLVTRSSLNIWYYRMYHEIANCAGLVIKEHCFKDIYFEAESPSIPSYGLVAQRFNCHTAANTPLKI